MALNSYPAPKQQQENEKPPAIKGADGGKTASSDPPAKIERAPLGMDVSRGPDRIQPLDVLTIHGLKPLEESATPVLYTVDAKGCIHIRLAGSISVVNLTLEEAQKKIEEKCKNIIAHAAVLLTVTRSLEREIELAHMARNQAAESLHKVRKEEAEARDAMRIESPLTASELKTRIAAYQAEKTNLEIQKISVDSRLRTILTAQAEGRDSASILTLVNLTEKTPLPAKDVDQYIAALKQQLQLIDLQGKSIQHVLDDDRAMTSKLDKLTRNAETLDEQCKRIRQRARSLGRSRARTGTGTSSEALKGDKPSHQRLLVRKILSRNLLEVH